MMNLDEAIKHCEEVAEENEEIYEAHCRIYSKEVVEKYPSPPCKKCADEHRQLAEWLKELKAYREERRMKLLIDIPEHIYEHAKEMSEDSRDEFDAMRAIANGSQQESRSEIPNTCGDAISRQAVDDAIYDYSRSCNVDYSQIMEYIEKLPSVTPQQRTGRWIMSDDGLYRPICNNCGAHPWKGYIPTVEEATEVFKYCPKCGSRMMEVEE